MAMSQAAAKVAVRAAIDSNMGPIPGTLTAPQQAAINAERDNLANTIAALIPYIIANAVAQPGTFSNGGGPVTGTGTLT